ncbi:hypothetical protein V2J09_012949 [Rumex salicifolius]
MRCLSTGRVDFLGSIFLSFLCFTLTCLLLPHASASPSISEKSVLLELKSSVSDPFGVLSSWISANSSDDLEHCSWYGVVCGSNSRVSALTIVGGGNLGFGGDREKVPVVDVFKYYFYRFGSRRSSAGGNGRLIGALNSVVAKLTQIRVLSLPFHGFSGEIPSEIWGLQNLEVLNLEGNSFTGNLPASFDGLRKLRVFNLGLNEIGGEIPDSLSRCVELEVLDLTGNQFRGPIPTFFGMLTKLSGLHLSSNSLEGTIPGELGHNCQNLQYLDLSKNALTGKIPRNLENCQQLRSLLLFSNQLQGVIPNTFGQLLKLEVLDVSRNSLTGTVPAELGHCTDLSVLVLSRLYHPLSSTVSAYRKSIDSSGGGNGEGNLFQGSIPTEITSLSKLKVLWAPASYLKGEIPTKWGENLEVINLSHNFFSGGIKGIFRGCKSLIYADLSANNLSGPLDSELPVPCMVVFDVSKNTFSGDIPRFGTGVCPPVAPTLVSYLEQFDGPSLAYTSFMSKGRVDTPTLNAKLAVIHNFGQNNFTGAIPVLPIAHSRLADSADYAFLADGNKLTGSFPGHLFDSCYKLNGMFVKVSNNRLSGRSPVTLGVMCKSLKFLDASGNRISGFIPQSFGDLESLVLLDQQQKDEHTELPVNLGRLAYLHYYSLSTDMLQGGLPYGLRGLLPVKVFSLSSSFSGIEILPSTMELRNLTALMFNINKLSSRVRSGSSEGKPLATSNDLARRSLLDDVFVNCSSAFSSCHLLNSSYSGFQSTEDAQSETASQTIEDSTASGGSSTRFNSIEIASIVSASAIVLVLLALIVLFIYTRKYAPKGGSRVQVLEKKEITVFTNIGVSLTFQNIVRATESFSTRNCIGSGGFGTTYRAEVSPGVFVAVKKLAVGRFHCVQQFHAEIKTLGRIHHPNLVTLIGYHASETEMFLIYNYLPGGNLEKFILDRSTRAVNWKVLHKIALDVAYALAYLHDSCDPRVIHRDVKPSNILLDNEFNAYLSDFGLSRLLGDSETHATTGVEGTFGYLAPEYAMTCRVSEKADVYSYGVVLLELISDKRALDPSFSGDGFNIVSWACMLLRQGRAKEVFTSGLWDSGPRDDLVEVLHLAVKCTLETLSIRPTMKQVVQRLKQLRPVS